MKPKIFMIEVLVNQIIFEPDLNVIPNPNDLTIIVRCKNLFEMIINTNEFPDVINQKNERSWGLNIGKTCIFTQTFEVLIAKLQVQPLEIALRIQNKKLLGEGIIPWKKEFSDMLSMFEQIGVVKSVDHTNDIDLKFQGKKIGIVKFYIRMGCGGDGLESDFRLTNEFNKNDWLLLHSKTLKSVLCEGFNPEKDDIVPIAHLYNPSLIPPSEQAIDFSWVDFRRKRKKSDDLDLFQLYSGCSNFDVISVCFVPNTNIFDIFNTEVTSKKSKEIRRKVPKSWTIDEIRKKLCSHSECPGVQKFEELGIVSSTNRNKCSDIVPSTRTDLKHINRNLDKYSSQSKYSPPVDPNVPFKPAKRTPESPNAPLNTPKCLPELPRPQTTFSVREQGALTKNNMRSFPRCNTSDSSSRTCSCKKRK